MLFLLDSCFFWLVSWKEMGVFVASLCFLLVFWCGFIRVCLRWCFVFGLTKGPFFSLFFLDFLSKSYRCCTCFCQFPENP